MAKVSCTCPSPGSAPDSLYNIFDDAMLLIRPESVMNFLAEWPNGKVVG